MVEAEVRLGAPSGAEVSRGIFGGFVEHFGTALYGGIWDLDAGRARPDVTAAVRGLGVTALRYPGGCFSDWYHWRDGVGNPGTRPFHPATYWTDLQLDDHEIPPGLAERFGPPEPNAFGTDEFLRYCTEVDAEPMLTANFGTGTPQEAAEWVAYTNRRAGSPRPVAWWFIGNEIFGDWELGHCPPEEYGRRFREYAAAMRAADPGVRLIAVGDVRNRGGWNEKMLAEAGDEVDMVSLHHYFPGPNLGRDLADTPDEVHQLLVGSRLLGGELDAAFGQLDGVGRRQLPVSLDEWNLWTSWPDLLSRTHRQCDSIYFGGCLNRMIERADRVRFAMISHLVNCMAPIQTAGDRLHVTAAYLTLLLYRRTVRRHPVATTVAAPEVDVPPFAELPNLSQALGGGVASGAVRVPIVDAAATADEHGTSVHVCAGTVDEPVRLTVHGLPPAESGHVRRLAGPGPFARNDFDAPDVVGFAEAPCATDARGVCTVELPPATVAAITVGDRHRFTADTV